MKKDKYGFSYIVIFSVIVLIFFSLYIIAVYGKAKNNDTYNRYDALMDISLMFFQFGTILLLVVQMFFSSKTIKDSEEQFKTSIENNNKTLEKQLKANNEILMKQIKFNNLSRALEDIIDSLMRIKHFMDKNKDNVVDKERSLLSEKTAKYYAYIRKDYYDDLCNLNQVIINYIHQHEINKRGKIYRDFIDKSNEIIFKFENVFISD